MVWAYMRRKEFEAEQVAMAVWRLFGEALSSGGRRGRRNGHRAPRREVSANYLMRVAGKEI